MSKRIISVDAGRSSLKSMDEKFNKLFIEARHGYIDFEKSKRSPYMMFNSKKDIIASVDGGPAIVYGKLTDVMIAQENVIAVFSDELYLEYSPNYVLVSIARLVNDGDDVVFNGNLTTNNFKYVQEFTDNIKGGHTVEFYDPSGNVIQSIKFSIFIAVILPQGQPALLSCAINSDLTTNELYLREGLTLDLGRWTVGALLTNMLNIKKDKSFDFQDGVGMETVYHYIKEELFDKYDLRYSTSEVERIIVNNEEILNRDKNVIDFDDIRNRAVVKVSERVKNAVQEAFGEYNPRFIIVAGGGVYLLGELMKKIFNYVEVLKDSVWANCSGLEKLALKGMKGLKK